MDHPGHLTHATKTGERTRKHHHKNCVTGDVNAGILRCSRVIADQADLIPPAAAVYHKPQDDRSDHADEETSMGSETTEDRDGLSKVQQAWKPGCTRELRRHLKTAFTPHREHPKVYP